MKATMNELLCGNLATMSILLGLFPVDFLTNALAMSTIGEMKFDRATNFYDRPGYVVRTGRYGFESLGKIP